MKSKIFHFKLIFASTLQSFVLFESELKCQHWKKICEKGMAHIYIFIVLEHTLKQSNCIPQRICTALTIWHSIRTTAATTNKHTKLMPFQYRKKNGEDEDIRTQQASHWYFIDVQCTLYTHIAHTFQAMQQPAADARRNHAIHIHIHRIVFDVLFTFIPLICYLHRKTFCWQWLKQHMQRRWTVTFGIYLPN